MRRHPTATSAGSDTSQATSLGSDRRTVATRGASSTSTGSGASAARGRLALLAIAVAAFALFAIVPLAQAKIVVNGFGTTGTLAAEKEPGGTFTNIRGLAINQTGAGGVPVGTVYVGDSTSRIERFSPNGTFERMWGDNVGGAGVSLCTVAASCKLGASTVTTANGSQVGAANNGPTIDQTNGHVLIGDATNFRITEFDADGNFIRTWGWDVVITGKPNNTGTGFEICDTNKGNVKTDCKRGVAGNGAGQFSSGVGFPTFDSSGNIWVTEATTGPRRIQEFAPNGTWMRAIGGDLITNGAEGTGTLATGTNTVKNVAMAKRYFEVGQTVTGPGIPAGTTITAVGTFLDAATSTLTISNNATESGAKVLTAAEGAGNKPVNEVQTVTINPAGTSGFFALQFAGGITGGFGTGGVATANSNVLTGVKLTQGTLKVGQAATARNNTLFETLPEGTTITKIEGSPENASITFSNEFSQPTTGLEVTGYDLPYNASAAEVQTQLNALPQIGGAGGTVNVTGAAGGPYKVEFAGTRFAGADVPQMAAKVTAIQPVIAARTGVVTSAQPNALESCSIPADCRVPSTGTAPGQFGAIAFDPEQAMFDSAGFLYATDRENNRVQRFDTSANTVSVFASGSSLAPYTAESPYRQAIGSNGNRLLFAVNNKISANEVQIIETDLTGAVKDTSLVGAKIPASGQVPVGLAENFTTGTIYISLQNSASNPSPRRVLMLNSTPPPATVQTLDPITVKDDVSATFTGTVDPTGGLVSCQFEYSTNQTTWTVVKETACNTMAQNGGPQPVTESVKEINPNTKYFVRLSVSRALIPESAVLTPVREFNTDAPPPVVTRTSAINITDSSARIASQIDPRHNDTEWIVEYGTTPGLGQETAALDIGDGGEKSVPVIASQVISGLDPGTLYYYVVKATNSTGPTSSALQSFTTRTEPLPPGAERHYEQVSPVDKNSNNIDAVNRGFGLQSTISLDGEAISFCSGSIFGDPAPAYNGLFSCYDAQREAGGWFTKGTIPNYCARDVNAETGTGGGAGSARWYSRYVDHSIFIRPEGGSCSLPILDPTAPNQPGANLYRGDLQSSPTTYDLLAPEPHFVEKGGELTDPNYNTSGIGEVVGGNDDYSRVFYTSNGQQTPNALPASKLQQLYEWHDGDVNLVSVKPDGTPFTTPSAGVRLAQAYHGISSSGDRMMFASPVPTHAFFTSTPEAQADQFYLCATNDCQIYMREDGTDTYEVSQSECTIAPCPEAKKYAAFFQYATNDTSKSWFTTSAKLTDDDTTTVGQDLYMYTQSANPDTDKNLTFMSKDNEPADGTEAKVQAVLGTSEDGNIVYFAGRGQLIAGQSIKSGFKVYKWDYNGGSPKLTMVVNLPPNEFEQALNWFRMIPNEHTLHREGEYSEFGGPAGSEYGHLNVAENVNVSTDGKYLLLMSVSQLVESADYDKYVDMYRWSEAEGLICVTCQGLGEAAKGDSFVEPPTQNGAAGGSLTQQYVMSADGKRVFFQTPDPLLPEDENTRAVQREAYKGEDVYEWNDGTLRLISTGRSSDYSYLLGITPDARDVFFVTTQPLVGWDIDPNSDIYDARIGGGFPEPEPKPAECEGESCLSGGSTPPTPTPAGTAVFDGPPNKDEIGVCEPGTRKATEKGKTVCKSKKKKPKHHKKKHHKKKAQSKKRDANNNRRTGR